MYQQEAIAHHPEADSFQFEGAFHTITQAVKGYKWVVLATILTTTLLVGAYIWIWPPVFEAEVMVAVDSDKDVQRTAFYQGWNIFRKDGLTEEGVLITSPQVLREVMRRLDLRYEDVYHPFSRYAIHLWTQSWVGRHYRKFKDWILGKEVNPRAPTPEEIERFKVLSDLKSSISIHPIAESSIGVLAVRASNQRVADIANTIVQVYLEQRRDRFTEEARHAHASLSEEAGKTQAEIDALDRQIRKFRLDSGAVLLFEKDRGQIGQYLTLRGSLADLRAVVAENRAALKVIDAQLAAEAGSLRSDRMFKEDAHKDRLPKLETALLAARQSFQPTSREVRDLEEQIREAQLAIAGNAQSVVVRNSAKVGDNYEVLLAKRLTAEAALQGAMSAIESKKEDLASMSQLLDKIPEKMQVNHELERQQSTLESKYAGLNAKLAVAAISMATARSAPPAMRVVEPAQVPEQASAPQTKLLLAAAAFAGLVVGIIVALLLDIAHKRVTRHRLQSRNTSLRLIAVVGQDDKLLQSIFPLPHGTRTLPDKTAGRS